MCLSPPGMDMYYSLNGDGKQGYLVSNRPGINSLKSKTCCDDIYTWEIEKIKINLNALTFARKKKGDKENPKLNGCTVMVFDVTEKNPAKVDNRTNAEGNNFAFTLAPEKQYLVIAQRDGYEPDSTTVNTVGFSKSREVNKELVLRTEKKTPPPTPPTNPEEVTYTTNEPIRLNNIYYDYDDDKILIDAEQDLGILYGLMNQYSDMVIELSSHTDARGNDKYNAELSQRRAESAKRWMVNKGISSERIVPKGYGESIILNGCTNGVKCDDTQHRFNRRTEFKILSGPTTITIKKTDLKSKNGGKQAYNQLIEYIKEETKQVKLDTMTPSTTQANKAWVNPADAIVRFDHSFFDVGAPYEGDIVRHTFTYTNIGKDSLAISIVSACHCIETTHTQGEIAPGAQGKVEVLFRTAGQLGVVNKEIDVLFNREDADGYPIVSRVMLKGKVRG
jgi:peptidoglycan-associated lipoprotein